MILEDKLKRHVDDLISRYPKLKEIEQQIIDAYLVDPLQMRSILQES